MDYITTSQHWMAWFLIACGAAYLLMPLPHWLTMLTLNRRLAKLESQLTPQYRERTRQQFAKSGIRYPLPVFRDMGWKFLASAAAHIVVGVVWLLFPIAG